MQCNLRQAPLTRVIIQFIYLYISMIDSFSCGYIHIIINKSGFDFVLVYILKRDIIPIYTFSDTHRGKGRTTFYIPNSSLQSCICLIASFVSR